MKEDDSPAASEANADLQGLSGLGVQVVEQAELERSVHSQATRDLAEQQVALERQRLSRLDNSLAKKREQLEKTHDSAERAKPGSARLENALIKVDRLEEEISQMQSDRNEIVARIRGAKAQVDDVEPKDNDRQELAEMLVPRRRAAVAAENRYSEIQQSSSDEPVPSDDDSDAYEPANLPQLSDEDQLDDNINVSTIPESRISQEGIYADDGDESMYQKRILNWCASRWRKRHAESAEHINDIPQAELSNEPFLPDPGTSDYTIRAFDTGKPGLQVPQHIWSRLLEYQRAGLRWMFTLHQQNAGGVLGDEMGLGKTVQIVSFLGSLYHSRMLSFPSIIVCPATLMRQWVHEFHTWCPALRVAILHNTGSAMRLSTYNTKADMPTPALKDTAEADPWESIQATRSNFAAESISTGYDSADDYEYDAYGSRIRRKRKPRGAVDWNKRLKQLKKKKKKQSTLSSETIKRAQRLVDHIQHHGHILIVTYSGLQMYGDILLRRSWGYAVLDEGHMIRNPDADATLNCKQLQTRHRLLITGTPIQNNLTELWSLFDFVFPGRLGTLPVFSNQFAVPIANGGFASANPLQVRAAYRCACVLRDLIEPYLLRRLKADVAKDLPKKSEQVLFCRLTPMQRTAYAEFLKSPDMERILNGRLQMLFGVDVARKICDHPDLLLLSKMNSAEHTHKLASRANEQSQGDSSDDEYLSIASNNSGNEQDLPPDYGDWRKSGKMTIVRALLEMWQPQGHKVLLFSQTRQMLDILERMVSEMPNLEYRRMDGMTPIQRRAPLVDEFNTSKSIFVFLLTTKVGGLGINLTGADRVILFSPDWNPSSDMQARERAWRLGQSRNVAVYRLMTAGTIEEKIYNRQIYKQFLSNKILEDPTQKRVFQSHSLSDLFSFSEFDASDNGSSKQQMAASRTGKHKDSHNDSVRNSAELQTTETGRMFANAQLHPRSNDQLQATHSRSSAPNLAEPRITDGPQIESIGGVVRLEPFKPASDNDREGDSSCSTPANNEDNEEDRVLQTLFKMSGMHSALQHDAIVNGREVANGQVIDQEADRIASEARTALRESQRERRHLDISVPTWTGVSGRAGIPGSNTGKSGASMVAPPPSAFLTSDMPVELELPRLRAVGKSQRKPLLPSTPVTHSLLPSRSTLNSMRQQPSINYRNSLQNATSSNSGKAPSSANILAGLRAYTADMRAESKPLLSRPQAVSVSSQQPSHRRTVHQKAQQIRSHTNIKHNARSPASVAPDHGRNLHDSSSHTQSRSNRDSETIKQIRSLLVRNNGIVSNRALMSEFASEFPLDEQPRLKQLASTIADLVSRQQGASRAGVGRIVQKFWRLKE
ncbi:DNA repair protein rhp26 [Coemansia sp. RSA 1290]|nr:DNA repair protein rhp26 [Coemansia sp. RSA 1290]